MSTEDRYRRLLRLLPAWYRERYGDEMVEVYLAGRSGSDVRPGAGEVAATVRLAVVTRLGAAGRPSAATLWLVAIAGLTVLASKAVWRAGSAIEVRLAAEPRWDLDASGHLVDSSPTWGSDDILPFGFHELLWLGALVLLLAGWRRVALSLAVPIGILDVSAGLGPLVGRDARYLPMPFDLVDARTAVLPVVVVAALMLAQGSAGPVPRVWSRLVAAGSVAAALAVLMGVVLYAPGLVGSWGDLTYWSPITAGLAVVAVAVLVACRRLDPAWPAAVMTLAIVAVVAGPLPDGPSVTPERDGASIVVGMIAAGIAVALAAVAWFLAADRYVPEHLAGARFREVVTT
ncbi:hypothetical protein ACR9E3_01015 [Actinomycetospora sp. C-140]